MDGHVFTLKWRTVNGEQANRFDLRRPITIGRHPNKNDIILEMSAVSRIHAAVFLRDGLVMVLNLSEKNRIKLIYTNGIQRLASRQSSPITHNTAFQISDAVFSVTIPENHQRLITPPSKPMLRCPRCGRGVPSNLRDCPYDGTSLVNAETMLPD